MKDECTAILRTISHHINSEHHELQSHRLLSIFKMAEVEVVWPESSRTVRCKHFNNYQLIIGTLLILMLIHNLPLQCCSITRVHQRRITPSTAQTTVSESVNFTHYSCKMSSSNCPCRNELLNHNFTPVLSTTKLET